MPKPSTVINIALAENAKEQARGGDPAYLLYLERARAEWQEALGPALASEAAADRAIAAAGIRNMAATAAWPSLLSMSDPAAATFTIEWEAPRWNYSTESLEWASLSVSGFESLPADVRAYMLAECPEVLPGIIADLAPADPAAALARHLAATRRAFN